MAISSSSIGPPILGPGSTSQAVGFSVIATTRSGVYFNREPLSGNTLCHRNNVERRHAIHENRLATAKPSLALSTPLRLNFMDKRLSKNYHARRQQAQVVHENLKLLRALEEIHCRDGSSFVGDGSAGAMRRVRLTTRNRNAKSPGEASCRKLQTKKLNLLARRRDVKAAAVARENRKMIKRMMQSKSSYSLDKMKKHRQRHERILRLRKTDYTAGHLFGATTSTRHWPGGSTTYDGSSNSFEERRPDRRPPLRASRSAQERSRRKSNSQVTSGRTAPGRVHSQRDSQGVRSAPRLPSLLDTDDIYGRGKQEHSSEIQASDTENPRNAAGRSNREECKEPRCNMVCSNQDNYYACEPNEFRKASTGLTSGSSGVKSAVVNSKKGTRGGSTTSPLQRGKGGSPGSVIRDRNNTRGTRGSDESLDSLSQCFSWGSDGLDGSQSTGGGSVGRESRGSVEVGKKSTSQISSTIVDNASDVDLDKIYNPLAFPDEKQGVRVLIQASKPLEVLNHAGETWICFIRIMVKDPFDGLLDIRIIHDREEVCKTVLSLEEARKIFEAAEGAVRSNQGVMAWQSSETGSVVSSSTTPSSSPPLEEEAGARNGRRMSNSIARPPSSEGDLNELLKRLFIEADTERKGYLTPEQLTSIMNHAELGLTAPELQLVVAEADENADGSIDYYEFVPMAYNLVHAFRARRRACAVMQDERLDLDQQAIHDLYDADFDRMVRQLKDLCRSFDPEGTGVLPRADFKQCISADRCAGLTKLESKLLLNLMPKDQAGNVIYRKLGAGLEQVRFTTLRNTVAEAAATVTHKYLMDLCREEDARRDHPHMKNAGDASSFSGKQYSGYLRAGQLTKLLLNAPLLSLSRLHVTAVMSHAHVVDGMVNYIEAVPMMAKTIEGIFHPRSVKMRHDILKMQVPGGGGASTGRGATAEVQGAATVLGKSRDDIEKMFIDILRDDKEGDDLDRLKNPKTFAKCMASLDLGLDSDTINALWEAADLNSREGTTFVDVVDFCFNCALFLEREKQVKALQRTITSITPTSQTTSIPSSGKASPSKRDESMKQMDPLLGLARALVRHAKVFSRAEGHVGVEFLDDSQIMHESYSFGEQSSAYSTALQGEKYSLATERSCTLTSTSIHDPLDVQGYDGNSEDCCRRVSSTKCRHKTTDDARHDRPDNTKILLCIRRQMPIVSVSGQDTAVPVAPVATTNPGTEAEQIKTIQQASSTHSNRCFEVSAAPGETLDMVIQVYWEGAARDRMYVVAIAPKREPGSVGPSCSRVLGTDPPETLARLYLSVRVPTLAIVDAQAATKFAERVAHQLVIGVSGAKGAVCGKSQIVQLRLNGLGMKTTAVVVGKRAH